MNHKKEFAELVNRYKDVIFKVCYVYASREELEDYYQEVLIQLWRSLPNFRNESKMSTWIYRVSLNKFEKAIILLWLEERDYEEIASIVGISKNNVAVKLNRIKEKLRKMSNQQNSDMELDELKEKWNILSEEVANQKIITQEIIDKSLWSICY